MEAEGTKVRSLYVEGINMGEPSPLKWGGNTGKFEMMHKICFEVPTAGLG